MNKVWVIAKREYLVNVRRVAFLIFTFGMPLIGLLLLVGGAFFSGAIGSFFERQFEENNTTIPTVGIVDQAAVIAPLLSAYEMHYRLLPSEEEGEAALRAQAINALIVIPPNYIEQGQVTVVSTSGEGGFSSLTAVDNDEMRDFLRAHLLRDQLDPTLRARILAPYTPVRVTLQPQGAEERNEIAALGNVMFGYAFGILLGIAVFTSAGYLLQGVARDKGDRIVEILLSSVSARQLLAGKVLGLGALGLTQLAVWLGSLLLLGLVGTTALGVTPAVFQFIFARPEFLLFDILYFVLGFLLYALLMGSVGALGTTQQESQQMAGVFTFLAVIPFMLGSVFLSNPNALLVRILSWFPITAPTAMLLRLPLTPTLPWIDIVISLGGVAVTIALAIWAGGKIFRLGLLIYGQRPSLRRVLRALREA
jgi:ABC-2 type transport system permease protein